MTQIQKVIKYMAIALAVVLIVAIFSTIIKLASLVILIVSPDDKQETVQSDMTILDVSESKNIELDLASVSLTVKIGDTFKASTNSDDIKISTNKNGSLKISEKERLTFISINDTKEELILEIPEGFEFDSFDLDSGAGIIEIDTLSAKKIDFDLGAGEVNISSLTVTNEADIEGGAGKITIGGTINGLELDMGIGELELNAKLTGKNKINFGIGNADITLIGASEDYNLNINKGVGSVTVDGQPLGSYNGSSNNNAVKVTLDCGVGNIDIDFE